MKENKPTSPPALENESRRKAVKTIVGGVTVLAAYHAMPVKWGTPIIEQVFLPAHAATSGSSLHDPCTVTHEGNADGTDTFLVVGFVTPPTEGLPTTIVLTPSLSGTNLTAVTVTTTTLADGTFSATIDVTDESDRVDVTTTVEGADGTASCFDVKPEEEACKNIRFTLINATSALIGITYDSCEGSEISGEVDGASEGTIFSVHPSRNVIIEANDYVTIDDGDGPEDLDEDTPREVNPVEHPVVTITAWRPR